MLILHAPSPGLPAPFQNITVSWDLRPFLVTVCFIILDLGTSPFVGVLRVLIKSLLSHSIFSLAQTILSFCHSFNSLLCFEDSPTLLRLCPAFYQTAPLGYYAVTKRIQNTVARIRLQLISLSYHSPEFLGIPGGLFHEVVQGEA